ncbi:hypothetical protein BU14_1591s0002 [Porphyra umbilicalis]|uniref:Secondary thiamine-phosphate synthase enzyme n=1 Tax=Porphyra umbilicalis TaxID=2786 RepID=A0A1X6NLF0_PORUM|nr:hypothetical protein BU14_1591s0002 [Porphyra umbilicalis]|eukprot:OSX69360.1 hypothetical protein BU14_1591s0002 [Porphyra umbilicalis]
MAFVSATTASLFPLRSPLAGASSSFVLQPAHRIPLSPPFPTAPHSTVLHSPRSTAPGSPFRRHPSRTAVTATAAAGMGVAGWTQKTFRLGARSRGCHLVTKEIVNAVPELRNYKVGLAHIFIRHTSAALTLNENADPDVRKDMKMILGEVVEDGHPRFLHRDEGDDDMAAHVVSSLVGASVSVPVTDGRLALGTWQGVWLVEWRNYGGERSVTVTVQGEKK